jgi:hypothetical protein
MLTMMMAIQKTVIQTATFTLVVQYCKVMAAAVISRGKTAAHWKT